MAVPVAGGVSLLNDNKASEADVRADACTFSRSAEAGTTQAQSNEAPAGFIQSCDEHGMKLASSVSWASIGLSRPQVTQSQAVRNLICGGLGTGMFSLPWAMAGASVMPGVIITAAVVAVNMWTIMILVEGAEQHQVFDLGNLLSKLPGALGTFMQWLTNIVVWIALMGSLISYLIAIHDALRPFLTNTIFANRLLLVSTAALAVLPLCFLDQKYLSCTSLVALVVNVYLFVVICDSLGLDLAHHAAPTGLCFMGFASGGATMVSTMMNSIIIQMCVLPMYEELENRSPRRFLCVLIIAFTSLGMLFAAFATVSYLAFGENVDSNVLNDLPTNQVSDVARIAVVGVVAAVYPIMVLPMVAPIRNLSLSWFSRTSDELLARRRRSLLVSIATVALVVISLLGSWQIHSLGIINVIDGAICVGVFTSLGPAMVGLFLLRRTSFLWRLSMWVLIVFGIAMSAAGFFFLHNQAGDLAQHCFWHV